MACSSTANVNLKQGLIQRLMSSVVALIFLDLNFVFWSDMEWKIKGQNDTVVTKCSNFLLTRGYLRINRIHCGRQTTRDGPSAGGLAEGLTVPHLKIQHVTKYYTEPCERVNEPSDFIKGGEFLVKSRDC
jgi:hypothetical protein